jgi:large subunit ribosomal protein L4
METKLFDKQGKEIGSVKLSDALFNNDVNTPVVWENVMVLMRNKRTGHASTKTRDEVRGGGVKPWRQKGIGWARHGSIRSPIWRGGGIVFGPRPRDYSTGLPKKKKMKALLATLSARAKENKIRVVQELELEAPKTKLFVEFMKNINLYNVKTLVGVEKINKNLKFACRNLPYVTLKRIIDINCLDVLLSEYILLTKKGLQKLEQRCATKKS